jgi:diketogulonate reductase-like aldo/keto reductase
LGARNAAHVDDHRKMFTFELDTDDKAAIDAVLAKGKEAERGLLHVRTRRSLVE